MIGSKYDTAMNKLLDELGNGTFRFSPRDYADALVALQTGKLLHEMGIKVEIRREGAEPGEEDSLFDALMKEAKIKDRSN